MKDIYQLKFILLLFFISNAYGQEYFEGEIHYKISYEPMNQKIPIAYLEKEMGSSFTAYVQEDRYLMKYHAEGENGWMKIIVDLKEGYTYTESEKQDTISKTKFGINTDKLINFARNIEDKKQLLGEECESISISYEPSDPRAFYQTFNGKYYFNPKYKLNAKLYENYSDGFWNLYVKEAQSISVRNETEFYPLFRSIQEAVSIEEKVIPDDMFDLDPTKYVDVKDN